MPYLDLDGERIYYALHRNQADGVPVLLIHGAGENHLVWPIGLRRLPGAIVYADRSAGARQIGGNGAQHDRGLRRMGGIIPRSTAHTGGRLHRPFDGRSDCSADWRSLILIGQRHWCWSRLAQNCVSRRSCWKWRRTTSRLRSISSANGSGDRTAPEELKQLGKQQLMANDPAVMLNDYRACDAFDVREQLKSITAPTLIVAGEADQMTPLKHATFLAEQIPQARLIVVPRSRSHGHAGGSRRRDTGCNGFPARRRNGLRVTLRSRMRSRMGRIFCAARARWLI